LEIEGVLGLSQRHRSDRRRHSRQRREYRQYFRAGGSRIRAVRPNRRDSPLGISDQSEADVEQAKADVRKSTAKVAADHGN